METNIYYHSECDFQIQNEVSISKWLKDSIANENKELGEINYIFCEDNYLLKKNQEYLKLFYNKKILNELSIRKTSIPPSYW